MNDSHRVQPTGADCPSTGSGIAVHTGAAVQEAAGRSDRAPSVGFGALCLPADKLRSPVGFPSRRPELMLHVAKIPEGSQTQSESTLTLPSNCPNK